MKRCLECGSSFPDTNQFCDLDGARLVGDYSESLPEPAIPERERLAQLTGIGARQGALSARSSDWQMLTLVAIAGAIVVAIGFIIYLRMTRETPQSGANEQASGVAFTQPEAPRRTSLPTPAVSATPSPESSPSPSASPAPSVIADAARVSLSSSPVSTGGDDHSGRAPVTIQLTNGTAIQADDAWQTREGIWYRRRGVVTLLDSDQVKAIERPTDTNSPASARLAAPAASPSASP